MSMVISKNFPWFNGAMSPEGIAQFVREYKRILEPNGKILLLSGSDRRGPESAMKHHIQVALELGLTVEFYHGQNVQGLILTKPSE